MSKKRNKNRQRRLKTYRFGSLTRKSPAAVPDELKPVFLLATRHGLLIIVIADDVFPAQKPNGVGTIPRDKLLEYFERCCCKTNSQSSLKKVRQGRRSRRLVLNNAITRKTFERFYFGTGKIVSTGRALICFYFLFIVFMPTCYGLSNKTARVLQLVANVDGSQVSAGQYKTTSLAKFRWSTYSRASTSLLFGA